jgi:hypothetical protein
MAWKKSDSLIGGQLRRHGLSRAVTAGIVCQEAERLYPNLFKATSLVGETLKVTILPKNQIPFRLIEGKLLAELQAFAEFRSLPFPTKTRLTVTRNSDTLQG